MAAEEFKYPVEGFDDADQHDDDDEVFRGPLPVGQRLPVQKKEEQSDEGEPFEKFNFGGKRKERKRE